MNIIYKRQSVRNYTEQEITEEDMWEMAKAGLVAPSSKNKQPWELILVQEQVLCQEMAKAHSNWQVLKEANKCIIMCGNLEKDERIPHMLMACGAATQNILLEATRKGIGSVWLGAYPDTVRVNWIKEKFKLPEGIVPIAVIALGYPQNESIRKDYGDELKIHRDCW